MKKILFANYNLNVGGVQKTLLNILNNIDLKKYEIDLLLFEKENKLISQLPEGINLLYVSDYVDTNIKTNIITRFEKNLSIKKFIRKYKGIIDKKYDVAIAFDGYDNNIDLIVPNINARKKIIWVHNDFYNIVKHSKFSYLYKLMFKQMGKKFQYFDEIAVVCDEVADGLNLLYNNKYASKIRIINNYIDTQDIINKAKEKSPYTLDGKYNIVSVGRLCKAKNFEKLISIHKKLIENNYEIKTYIIGGGKDQEKLYNIIKKNNLQDTIILLGSQINPYSLIKQADLCVSTSLYESYAITILESLVLGVPVISTDTSGAKNIVNNIADTNTCLLAKNDKELYDLITIAIKSQKKINELNLKDYNKKVMDSINKILT